MSVGGDSGDLVLRCVDGAQNKTVKKVVDYQLLNGKRYYKVKWECSWEEEDNLVACQQLVEQFWGFVNRVKSEDTNTAIYKKKDNMLLVVHEEESGSDQHQDCEQQGIGNICFNDNTTGLTLVDEHAGGGEKNCGGESRVCEFPSIAAIGTSHQPQVMCIKAVTAGDPIGNVEKICGGDSSVCKSPSMAVVSTQQHALCIKRGTAGIPQYPSTTKRSHKLMNTKDNFSDESCDVIDLKMQQLEKNMANGEGDGERKFQCDVCGMAFKRKDMCKRHSRTHSNDFCYFCSICKRGFIRRYILVKHLYKDHQTNDETKIISNKRRRRDIIKQELISSIGMEISDFHMKMKIELDNNDSMITNQSEYKINHSNHSMNNDEHDYNKKTPEPFKELLDKQLFKAEFDKQLFKPELTGDIANNSEKLSSEGIVELGGKSSGEIEDVMNKRAVIVSSDNLQEHVGMHKTFHNEGCEKLVCNEVLDGTNDVPLVGNLYNNKNMISSHFLLTSKQTDSVYAVNI